MDPGKVVSVLEGTMNPNLRKEAEDQLEQMHKVAGFSPLLLQLIMSDEIAMPVRQSGAVYLKNMCTQAWHDRVDNQGTPVTDLFSIHENDRVIIRGNIVEAIIHAPGIIRSQLTVIVSNIIKYDYPEKWPSVIEKIQLHLQGDNHCSWMGALLTLYQLVKNYEFKKVEDRGPLIQAMKVFLPVILQLFNRFIADNSEASALLQKQLLKILYALVQYSLPLELFNEHTMDEWMKLLRVVVERTPPEETLLVDELERPELPWWKCKKWAMHFLARVFERYGSPGTVVKEYNSFADFFLKRYAVGIVQVVLKLLDSQRKKEYISPRVMQQGLHFLDQAVSHAVTWKVIKGHYQNVLKQIIFPLMCFNDDDQEMWDNDPHEYIRMKFDVFNDYLSPSSAAQCFLHSACTKRQQVLQKTMGFCHEVLTQSRSSSNAESSRNKDGVLHIIGSLADTLLKRKIYKDQIELLLVTHVLPEFSSEFGFMRARACWVFQRFNETKFRKKDNIINTVEGLKHLLLSDTQLPTRVEAAIAIQCFLTGQEIAEKHCTPHVHAIIKALLELVHETENDDLTTVVQKFVCLYCEQVIPYAVDITQNLTMTFLKLLDGSSKDDKGAGGDVDDGGDERAVTAMSILSTIETVLDMMEEEREITLQLEGIVAPLVAHVLKNRLIDYYEEIFSLMYSLTCQAISPPMWEALPLIAEVFEDDGFDYFTEMMPCLHNFCTIDTQTLLSNPSYMEIMFAMCKKILETEESEDPVCHAAKLLEVIILQCRGQIDQCIPLFVEAVLSRLTREVKTGELRTMCLQVVIAALYYNPTLLMHTLENMHFPNTIEPVTEQFFRQWINDVECFLGIHDRRMCVLGLCTLLNMNNRPSCVEGLSLQIIPSLIMLFQGLIRAYKVKGEEERSISSESSEENEDDEGAFEHEELASDEDEIDEESAQYLEMLQKRDDDKESIRSDEETELESFNTVMDEAGRPDTEEFSVFKKSIAAQLFQRENTLDIGALSKVASRLEQERILNGEIDDDDDDEDSLDLGDSETLLEEFATAIDVEESSVDEFVAFKAVFSTLEVRDPNFYNRILTSLNDDQRKTLQDIYVLADQRLAAAESKKIEKTGGYRFDTTSVPTTFNFAASRPPTLSP